MKLRYIVTSPIEGEEAWFDVRDTLDEHMPNKSIVSIFKTLPGKADPRSIADKLCAAFNAGSEA